MRNHFLKTCAFHQTKQNNVQKQISRFNSGKLGHMQKGNGHFVQERKKVSYPLGDNDRYI